MAARSPTATSRAPTCSWTPTARPKSRTSASRGRSLTRREAPPHAPHPRLATTRATHSAYKRHAPQPPASTLGRNRPPHFRLHRHAPAALERAAPRHTLDCTVRHTSLARARRGCLPAHLLASAAARLFSARLCRRTRHAPLLCSPLPPRAPPSFVQCDDAGGLGAVGRAGGAPRPRVRRVVRPVGLRRPHLGVADGPAAVCRHGQGVGRACRWAQGRAAADARPRPARAQATGALVLEGPARPAVLLPDRRKSARPPCTLRVKLEYGGWGEQNLSPS
eukprot:6305977-Prymnesium_polylepis.1